MMCPQGAPSWLRELVERAVEKCSFAREKFAKYAGGKVFAFEYSDLGVSYELEFGEDGSVRVHWSPTGRSRVTISAPSQVWDGIFSGKILPADAYVRKELTLKGDAESFMKAVSIVPDLITAYSAAKEELEKGVSVPVKAERFRYVNVCEAYADFTVNLRFEDIPESAVKAAKDQLLNILAATFAGARTKPAQILAETVRAWGDREESSVFGFNFKTSMRAAAFVNSCNAVNLDYDDHILTCHAGVSAVPTSLAVGEALDASGKEVLTAQIIGDEIEARIVQATWDSVIKGQVLSGPPHAIGAAAITARLMGLGKKETMEALGIAGSIACMPCVAGFFGPDSKHLVAGVPVVNGIVAAQLARNGFYGSYEIFESLPMPFSFPSVVAVPSTPDYTKLTKGLGERYLIEEIAHKPYAVCGYFTSTVDCLFEIIEKYDVKPDEVESVNILLPELSMNARWSETMGVDIETLRNRRYYVNLEFFVPYAVAMVLIDRELTAEQYKEEKYLNPKVHELMRRVTFSADPELTELTNKSKEGGLLLGSKVTVKLKDGREYHARVDKATGSPGKPFPIEEKFRREAGKHLSKSTVEEVIQLVERLESASVRELVELLTS